MKTTAEKETVRLIADVKAGRTPFVVCPACGHGGMQEGVKGWECPWRDCYFTTFDIPYTVDIQRAIALKKQLAFIKKYKI